MPDLGKYAFAVLASYGVGLVALGGMIALSLLRHRAVKRRLAVLEAEARAERGRDG